MDLRLFHNPDNPNHNYKNADRLNSWTGLQSCRFLELTGWYNSSIPYRLLGHYRRFQLYKKHRYRHQYALPSVQGYILQYRASFRLRRYCNYLITRLPAMWGRPDETVEMHAINKILIHHRSDILIEFLTNAETDFEQALKNAIQQIHAPEFLSEKEKLMEKETVVVKQTVVEKETIVEKQTILARETVIEKEIKSPKELPGKEKGVFSKRQVLIFLDLITSMAGKERLAINKQDDHPEIAAFLQALTGKGIDTWLETLKDYRNDNLYRSNTVNERNNLISTITNVAEIAWAAGLKNIYRAARSKIELLEDEE